MLEFTKNSSADIIISKDNAKIKWTEKKTKNLQIACKLIKLSKMCENKAETLLKNGFETAAYIEKYHADEYRKRGYRMKDCSRFISLSVCPDCHRSIASSATLCRDRVCPTCSWRLSAKQSAEMLQTISLINDIEDYKALFLTLTVQNCDCDQLSPTLEMMSKSWNRLLARKKNRELIAGSARSVEITYNNKNNTFHPHYHIILLLNNNDLSIAELSLYFNSEWKSAANLLYTPITDLRKIENKTILEYDKKEAEFYKKAILETFKYTIKDDSLSDMPLSTFRYYIDGIQGKRLIAYTGIIKEARAKLEFDEDLTQENTICNCPDCNTEMISAVYQWSFKENTYKRFIDNLKNS